MEEGLVPLISVQGVRLHEAFPEPSGSLGVKYDIFLSLCVFFFPSLTVQDFFLNVGFT